MSRHDNWKLTEPPKKPMPRCPVCGAECNDYYIGATGQIVGCEDCVDRRDAWEWMEDNK